ncbi:MAG TPA: hypothetical protein VKB38_21670 [Terracidiphilus sp.]|nr:hypothetical protein [Terracidiphilus sp.]
MNPAHVIALCVVAAGLAQCAAAQDPPAQEGSAYETRYSIAVINDATFYANTAPHVPAVLNQMLVEPTFDLHYRQRWSFSTSLIGGTTTYTDNTTQLHVRETYTGLSVGDFDFTAGRKLVRWGTGYAFTAAGVLDPPRNPTDPTDRLNLNEGRDMIKTDYVRGPHAFTLAWSTAELARSGTNLHDTTAFRYNVLVYGFDTALIAGNDRGSDTFGGFTFTRVLGQAWEVHGESMWREQEALLLGAKYVMHSGVTFIGEFYTPPNTPYYRDAGVSPFAGRQHYGFLYAGKSRLRQLPGWKEWDVSGSIVTNFDDHSYTGVFDVNRWFGTHFSAYAHVQVPAGGRGSEFGAAPYASANSFGVRFQL